MTQTWTSIIAAALFLMGHVSGAVMSVPPADGAKVVVCHMACCSDLVCQCDMAPPAAPAKPAPMAPLRAAQDLRSMPVLMAALRLPVARTSIAEPNRPTAPALVRPHSPPPLALHCALLI